MYTLIDNVLLKFEYSKLGKIFNNNYKTIIIYILGLQ